MGPILAVVLSVIAAGPQAWRTAAAAEMTVDSIAPDQDLVPALEAARARTVRARTAVDALKRVASPAHLLDPLPEPSRNLAVESLRRQYAELQLRSSNLRTTLGDRHPDLMAAEQALMDLRGQLLSAVRVEVAAAERELTDARSAEGVAERRLAARLGDVTGSIGPQASTEPTARPSLAAAVEPPRAAPLDVAPVADPAPSRMETTATLPPAADDDLTGFPGVAAVAGLAAVAVALAVVALVASRRRRSASLRRAASSGLAAGVALDDVPILAVMALPAAADASKLAAVLGRDPQGTLARAATRVVDLLHQAGEASGSGGRVTVLVTSMPGSIEAEAVAASMALADAVAGRQVLLMDARPEGRLRASLVPGAPVAELLEFGSVVRPAYHLAASGTSLAVLPSDAGEAAALKTALARSRVPRRKGLSGYDTVFVLGSGIKADAEMLVAGADLVVIAAPQGTPADRLSQAAEDLKAGAGRPCGAVLVATEKVSEIELASPDAKAAAVDAPQMSSRPRETAPRERHAPARYQRDRGGFRGSFDPSNDLRSA